MINNNNFYLKSLVFLLVISFSLFITHSKANNSYSTNTQSSAQISVSGTLYNFGDVYTNTISNVQYYYVSASNLTDDLIITASDPFKVSLSCHDNYSTTISIPHSGGSIAETRIYVRFFPTSTGNFSGSVANASTGATIRNVSVSGNGVVSQIPSGYYSTAIGMGEELIGQLHKIVNNHTVVSYSSIWTHIQSTDSKYNGKVWDIYSDIQCEEPPYEFTFSEDQQGGGSYPNQEGVVYNREHSWPRSWWGGSDSDTMFTDINHVYPTDRVVNEKRSNWPYGIVSNPSWTSMNGGKLGNNTEGSDYSSTAFEPIDEYKGDLARTYFYMVTRYLSRISSWAQYDNVKEIIDGSQHPAFKPWFLEMLLEWHNGDPVSQKEIDRNNAIYSIQGNRNPFIDNPEFVNSIWGDPTDPEIIEVVSIAQLRQQDIDEETIYRITGEVILTFQHDYRNKKYIQDPNGSSAIEIDDPEGIISSSYNLYDGISEIEGTLGTFNNLLQLTPTKNTGSATSTGNNVTPEEKSLSQISNSDQSKLIKVKNVSFNQQGNFENATSYNISDPSGTLIFRTQFNNVDYIGTSIPQTEQDVVAIVFQYQDELQIAARSLNDFEESYVVEKYLLTLLSSPNNIGAELTGEGDYEEAAEVNISASEVNGYIFTGWTGSNDDVELLDDASAISTSFIMPAWDVTLTATYEPESTTEYTLTINIEGNGKVEVNDIEYSEVLTFYEGTSITLVAIPDVGWEFFEWTGDIESDTSTETIIMDSDKTITATFTETEEITYTLTINIEGSGEVEVNGNTYTQPLTFIEGEDISIEAIPDNGWQFDGWSGDIESISVSETVTIDSDKTITANFSEIEEVTYTLIVSIEGSGEVEVNGNIYTQPLSFEENEQVNIEAIPQNGWQFVGWRGDLVSESTMETITIDNDKNITATFTEIEEVTYTLTVNIEGSGDVEVNGTVYTQPLTFDENDAVFIEAIPDVGWQFNGWTDDLESNNTSETIIMNANKTITAIFTEQSLQQFTLTISIQGDGMVEVDRVPYIDPITVAEGTVLLIEAFADEGWLFDEWSGDIESEEPSHSITMDDDKSLIATFSIINTVYETLLDGVEVYPNPFENYFLIDNAHLLTRLEISNLLGQKLKEMEFQGSQTETIHTENLIRGVYLITIHGKNGERLVKRMVKE